MFNTTGGGERGSREQVGVKAGFLGEDVRETPKGTMGADVDIGSFTPLA